MKTAILLCLLFFFPRILISSEMNELWVCKTNGRIYSTPLISGNKIFFGSGDSCFYALDKESGKQIWKFKTNGPVHSSPQAIGNAVVFASGDGKLYSLDLENGSLNWSFSSQGEKTLDLWDYYLSSPKAFAGLVYWGSGDCHFYAIEAQSGKLKWKFKSQGIIHCTPEIVDGIVYFGDYGGYFYAFDALSGEIKWQFHTVGETYFPNGEIQKGALVSDGVVYFGSRDYNFYALDTKTGRGRWNMKERGSWVIAAPLLYNGKLYFGTSDTHRFYCLDKTSGKIIWQIQVPMRVYGSATEHNGLIWFGCFDGKLRGLHPNSGEIKKSFQTEGSRLNYSKIYTEDGKFKAGFELYGNDYIETERLIHSLGSILSTPVIDNEIMYFGSSDGGLYAVPLY